MAIPKTPWSVKREVQNAGLDEAQAGIKIDGRNINNLRYADNTTLMEESEEELKSLLMKSLPSGDICCRKRKQDENPSQQFEAHSCV